MGLLRIFLFYIYESVFENMRRRLKYSTRSTALYVCVYMMQFFRQRLDSLLHSLSRSVTNKKELCNRIVTVKDFFSFFFSLSLLLRSICINEQPSRWTEQDLYLLYTLAILKVMMVVVKVIRRGIDEEKKNISRVLPET